MWKLRLWFTYPIICLSVRQLADNISSKIFYTATNSTPDFKLSPKSSWIGYLVGALTALLFFFNVSFLSKF